MLADRRRPGTGTAASASSPAPASTVARDTRSAFAITAPPRPARNPAALHALAPPTQLQPQPRSSVGRPVLRELFRQHRHQRIIGTESAILTPKSRKAETRAWTRAVAREFFALPTDVEAWYVR